jgi:hypothetical protein
MSLTFTAFNGLLAILAWEGEPGTTYTVQTSEDRVSWSTLPAVFGEGLEDFSVALETHVFPIFARLRFSADGDTNENGLPDLWELSHFGILDVDPLADPDKDGASNRSEWIAGSDPLDFYNGARPRIRLACGDRWIVPVNGISGPALSLILTDSRGDPWPDAPVSLHMQSGAAGILQSGEKASRAVQEVTAYTDSMGRITTMSHAIHVLGSPQAGHRDQLHIAAGGSGAAVCIQTIAASIPQPPRDLKHEIAPDGPLIIAWQGNPGEAEGFIVESLSNNGDWIPLAGITASELPDPDPATGRFQLSINSD